MLKKIIFSLSIVTLGFVLNCGGNLQTGSGSPTSLIGLDGLFSKAVTVPSFDQPTGTYGYSPVVINITTTTPASTIYYSIDGGLTWTQGALYSMSATATISGSTTLIAYASASGMIDSTISTATYTIIFPPNSLTYSQTSPIYPLNQAITNNVPTVTGTVTSWSVTPPLPAGLNIDANGIIYGIPTAVQAATPYTITAGNAGGTTIASITIAIGAAYNYTGTVQTFVVPAGVTSINVDATGAQGAGYNNSNPDNNGYYPPYGLGTRVQANLPVTPGETLYINVGGNDGYNGGGSASSVTSPSAGNGGGASDIRQYGNTLTDRVLVAAGGGGSGDGINGVGGGILYPGSPDGTGYRVWGGNASGPGDQGYPDSDGFGGSGAYGGTYGGDGTLGQGGDGGTGPYGDGGGGGGGYYGGGGGGSGYDGAGGGGGSNLVPSGGTATCGYPRTGDGIIIISW